MRSLILFVIRIFYLGIDNILQDCIHDGLSRKHSRNLMRGLLLLVSFSLFVRNTHLFYPELSGNQSKDTCS